MRSTGTSTNVLVAHSTLLIAEGMASLLGRQPRLSVNLWQAAQGSWDSGAGADIDVVFADVESIRRSRWTGSHSGPYRVGPKIILVTGSSPTTPTPAGISGEVSVECGEEALLTTLSKITENLFTASATPMHRPTGGLAPGALRRVRQHIDEHLADRVEMRELAALTGLSACHFSRAFKQSVGMPPHRFLMSRRILVAADLVSGTDRAFCEVALEVGFSDQSHFTRLFSSMVGETPSAFRRRHR